MKKFKTFIAGLTLMLSAPTLAYQKTLKMSDCTVYLRGIGHTRIWYSDCGHVKYAVIPSDVVSILINKGYKVAYSQHPNNLFCSMMGSSYVWDGQVMNYIMNESVQPAWSNLILVVDYTWRPVIKVGAEVWANVNLYQHTIDQPVRIFSKTEYANGHYPYLEASAAVKAAQQLPRCIEVN